MKIAVYSGSFDPLHIGHLAIMEYLTQKEDFDWVYLASKEPWSSNRAMRSRAVSLPCSCCLSMRFWPPPILASLLLSRSSFIFSSNAIFEKLFGLLNGVSLPALAAARSTQKFLYLKLKSKS